jgi:hypothetical protein
MKNFVKAMGKTGPANRYLTEKCPGISDAKIRFHRSTSSSEISS